MEITIKEITILVNETIASTYEYIENAIPLINKLAEEFYNQPNQKTWEKLTDLFEGIQWIIQSLTQIDSINNLSDILNDYEIWNEYVQEVFKLNNVIPELENAIISEDNILIGDILMYEVISIFKTMIEKIVFLKPKGVDNNVS